MQPAASFLAPIVALVLVQMCFGLFPVFGKWSFEAFSPAGVAAWRITAGAAVLLPVALAVWRRAALPPLRDAPRLLGCALLGVVLNQGLFVEGLARSTAMNAGMIMCVIPPFTYALALAAGQERWRPLRALGVLLALAGLVPFFLDKGSTLFGGHGFGNLLIGVNALCYSGYLVLSKPLLARLPPLVVIGWVYAFSAAFLPWFVAHGSMLPRATADPELRTRALWSMGYVLLFATVLAYLLNTWAMARVRASTTAFFVYLQPIVTGAAGALLLGETLDRALIPAAALVFAGTWLVVQPGRAAAAAPRAPAPR